MSPSHEPRGPWGRRWLAQLDVLGPVAERAVRRGRALARDGAVSVSRLGAGVAQGRVADGRDSCEAGITWPVPSPAHWRAAVAALRAEVRFVLPLLEGRLDEDVVDALADAGVALFPPGDRLEPRCTCDRGWCRHAVAVHAEAGARIDLDPHELFELAGRSAPRLVAEVRQGPGRASTPVHEPVGDLDAPRGDLDAVVLQPRHVEDPGADLRRLGAPPGMRSVEPIAAAVERAAGLAWRLAAGEGVAAADEEALLTELRAQRTATASELAATLGLDEPGVRRELERLYGDGAVLRTGSGDTARYRAVRT